MNIIECKHLSPRLLHFILPNCFHYLRLSLLAILIIQVYFARRKKKKCGLRTDTFLLLNLLDNSQSSRKRNDRMKWMNPGWWTLNKSIHHYSIFTHSPFRLSNRFHFKSKQFVFIFSSGKFSLKNSHWLIESTNRIAENNQCVRKATSMEFWKKLLCYLANEMH